MDSLNSACYNSRRRVETIIASDTHKENQPHSRTIFFRKLDAVQYPQKSQAFFQKINQRHQSTVNELTSHPWDKSNTFQFPRLFKYFQNVGFALLLMPFRIIDDGNVHTMRTPSATLATFMVQKIFAHQIFCTIIHVVLLLKNFLSALASLTIKLRQNPKRIFEVITTFANAGLLVSFIWTGWTKKEAFKKLHQSIPTTAREKFVWKNHLIFIAISIIPIVQYGMSIALAAYILSDPPTLQKNLAAQLWSMRLRSSKFLWSNGTHADEITDTGLKIIGYAGIIIDSFLQMLFRIHADILVFIAALSVREIANKYLNVLKSLTTGGLQDLSDRYLQMEKQIKLVNNCTGPIVLGWFTVAATFFLEAFFYMFAESNLMNKIVNFLVIVHNIVTMYVAADAHNTALECKSLLLERGGANNSCQALRDEDPAKQKEPVELWSPAFVGYLEMSEEDVGVRGSEFFVISNKFIGGMISMLVTYLLIMLQFNLEIDPNESG